jgi:hypothetical protein
MRGARAFVRHPAFGALGAVAEDAEDARPSHRADGYRMLEFERPSGARRAALRARDEMS